MATGDAVRIDPRYGPFAAARDTSAAAQQALGKLLCGPDDEIWVVESALWPTPPGARRLRHAELLQMVAETPLPPQVGDDAPLLLGDADVDDMTALAHATQPGPWAEHTHRFGDFYGYRHGGALQAMAGARMLPAPGWAEVSGVCTWPQWQGQGLAGRLIRRVMADMVAGGDTPFLHSYAANAAAISLYESLGFRARRNMVVTIFRGM